MRNNWLLIVLFAVVGSLCACHDDDEAGSSHRHVKTQTYKVAVVMPASHQERWQRTADWAMENIAAAQDTFSVKVKLELEWYDEDKADGLEDYLRRVEADPSYAAIIGPLYSKDVHLAGTICQAHHKPLILPKCTSSNVQRLFAETPNVFHLTQSDMGQIEALLSIALARQAQSVSLLVNYGDPTNPDSQYSYGATFRDWLGFLATEAGLTVDTVSTYSDSETLRQAVAGIARLYSQERYDTIEHVLLFAPDNSAEFQLYHNYRLECTSMAGMGRHYPLTLCSDGAVGDNVDVGDSEYEGIDISASVHSGFIPAYKGRFGEDEDPMGGEAQLFDAIYMLAIALTIDPDATHIGQTIDKISDFPSIPFVSWMRDDLGMVLYMLRINVMMKPSGTIGEWVFDKRYHSAILTTTYRHWRLTGNTYHTIAYLTLNDSRRTMSSEQLWEMNAKVTDHFDPYQADRQYKPQQGNYAVIVAGSTGWTNYRHQADALDMYQMLLEQGFAQDHIIFVMEGDILNDPKNLFPGEVRVQPDGENLYSDKVRVDYRPSALSLQDLYNILNGITTERTPEVLHSTDTDNVFFFWSGHGKSGTLFFDRQYVFDRNLRQMLQGMHDKHMFRKLFLVVEACYSGSVVDNCVGIPGVLMLTASNGNESSLADIMHPTMGIWMSNAFTRAFRTAIDNNPHITMRNLYYEVAQQTVGSHATMYNVENYGNMFTNTFEEFLKGTCKEKIN